MSRKLLSQKHVAEYLRVHDPWGLLHDWFEAGWLFYHPDKTGYIVSEEGQRGLPAELLKKLQDEV